MNAGNGRVYTITLAVQDAGGNVSYSDFKAQVPRWPWGWYANAVEDAPLYQVDCGLARGTGTGIPDDLGPAAALPGSSASRAGLDLAVYPNPFSSETNLSLYLPEAKAVAIEVFNIQGQRVRRLLSENLDAGEHLVKWDGAGESGQALSVGLYLLRVTAGEEVVVRKVSLQ
jgi:hypothetical protein